MSTFGIIFAIIVIIAGGWKTFKTKNRRHKWWDEE